MDLANPTAFFPNMGDEIAVHVSTRLPRPGSPGGEAEAVRIERALVCETEPDALAGAGQTADGRSVVFPLSSWRSSIPLTKGAWIAPDSGPLHRWGRLTVQEVRFLGGLVFLRCSEREAPAHG